MSKIIRLFRSSKDTALAVVTHSGFMEGYFVSYFTLAEGLLIYDERRTLSFRYSNPAGQLTAKLRAIAYARRLARADHGRGVRPANTGSTSSAAN